MCYYFVIVNILKWSHTCHFMCQVCKLRICEYKFYTNRSILGNLELIKANYPYTNELLVNSHKSSVLFVGRVQTVKTMFRRHLTRRLIRSSTVCLNNVLFNFE